MVQLPPKGLAGAKSPNTRGRCALQGAEGRDRETIIGSDIVANTVQKKKASSSLPVLRRFWAGDERFGIPQKYWEAAKNNNGLLRQYQVLCKKAGARGVTSPEIRSMLDIACEETAQFSYVSLKHVSKMLDQRQSA